MKKYNLDYLIEELIKENKIDDIAKYIEEDINIDPNIEVKTPRMEAWTELYDVNVNDKEYELSLTTMLLQSKKSIIELNFRLKNYKQLKGQDSNRGIETGITGTGDAKDVFDKIVSTAVVLIKRKQPDYITFQAGEQKRQRLYKLMVKQILRKVSGYKVSNISPYTNDNYDESEFWLEKI